MKLSYDYGSADNNGNVKSQTITIPTVGGVTGTTLTQCYGYDELDRLKTACSSPRIQMDCNGSERSNQPITDCHSSGQWALVAIRFSVRKLLDTGRSEQGG